MASEDPCGAARTAGHARPVIGLACGRVAPRAGGHSWQGVTEPYVRAVLGAGADPVMIPMGLSGASLAQVVGLVDGVLLVGGGDIEPSRYGEARHPKCGESDEERDQSEIALVAETLAQDKPLLAICRGIQVLNVALGGTLHQDIRTDWPESGIAHRRTKRQAPAHPVQIAPASRLARVLGLEEVWVNSMHHQAVKEVAGELTPVAWAPDGVIEAVERPGEVLVLGVQWHPEELVGHEEHARRLFRALAAAALDHQSRLPERDS